MGDSIEVAVLSSDVPQGQIQRWVDILNGHWSSFFIVEPEIMEKRLESGAFFLGAFFEKRPSALLETITLNVDMGGIETITATQDKPAHVLRIQEICRSMRGTLANYQSLTNKGDYSNNVCGGNTQVLVDLTKPVDSIKGIGDVVLHAYLTIILEENGYKRPDNVRNVVNSITYSPQIAGVRALHSKHGAFNTEVYFDNARGGYVPPQMKLKPEDVPSTVNSMCYLVPGYRPKLSTIEKSYRLIY